MQIIIVFDIEPVPPVIFRLAVAIIESYKRTPIARRRVESTPVDIRYI